MQNGARGAAWLPHMEETDVCCESCGRVLPDEDGRIPPSLRKALCDPFDYALKLRSGEVIRFSSALIDGDFVTLGLDNVTDDGSNVTKNFLSSLRAASMSASPKSYGAPMRPTEAEL